MQILFTSTGLIFTSYIPSIANIIAEPGQDMNIKDAAFTVSEKSINIWTCM